jgi:hypothetical protein
MFIGFAAMLFIAVSYRLLPMFYMTKTPDNLYWKTDLTAVNAGILAIIASSFFGNGSAAHIYLNLAGGWLLGLGILLYCYIFFNLMLKRLKKKFDITNFLSVCGHLIPYNCDSCRPVYNYRSAGKIKYVRRYKRRILRIRLSGTVRFCGNGNNRFPA